MQHPLSKLGACTSVALGLAATAIPAGAQTAAQTVQVLEISYSPTAANAALDLRSGAYLLALRGPATGPYTGLLRGPNGEVVSEGFPVAASGCTAGLGGATRLVTTATPGRTHLNQFAVSVTVGTACQLSFAFEDVGLSSFTLGDPPIQHSCPRPSGVDDPPNPNGMAKMAKAGDGSTGAQQCYEVPWPPQNFVPDLEPGPGFELAGQLVPWRRTITVSASQAQARSNGRCYFPWAFDTRNGGTGASSSTHAVVLVGRSFGFQLASAALPAIPAGTVAPAGGTIGLPPGRWRVFARIDPANTTLELNGDNNAQWINVEVAGRCTP